MYCTCRLSRQRTCRWQKVGGLDEEVQREKSGWREEHRPPTRSPGIAVWRGRPRPRFSALPRSAAGASCRTLLSRCTGSELQLPNQILHFLVAAPQNRKRHNFAFLHYHQRALPHLQLAALFAVVRANQPSRTGAELIWLILHFESTLLGEFRHRTQIIGRILDPAIILQAFRRNH